MKYEQLTSHITLWYSLRRCPIAVVLWSCEGDIYSIFVENWANHRWLILPGGEINHWETSVQWALRELTEETWRNDTSLLTHVGNLGSLYRPWGTDPRDDFETLLLDMKPEWHKYLFVKQQIYELFIIEQELCPIEAILSKAPTHDIASIKTMMLYPHNQRDHQVTLPTDRIVLQAITDSLDKHNWLLTWVQSDLEVIRAQIVPHANNIII